MKIETLTEKLRARSDDALRKRLHAAFWELRGEFTDGSTKPMMVKGGYIQGADNISKTFCVDAHAALEALENLSFEMQKDKARDKEINDFMRQVESLHESIEQLQSGLQ